MNVQVRAGMGCLLFILGAVILARDGYRAWPVWGPLCAAALIAWFFVPLADAVRKRSGGKPRGPAL
jgi:hypothetical protein